MDGVKIKSLDEIGHLAKAFNSMASNLRNLFQQVGTSADYVAASAEQLLASSDQTVQIPEHIAFSIQEVALGSQQQASDVEKAAQTVSVLASDVHRIDVSSQSALITSSQASEASITGIQVIQETYGYRTINR